MRWVAALTFVVLCVLVAAAARADAPVELAPDIEFFTNEDCPHCAEAQAFLRGLQLERPELVVLTRQPAHSDADRARLRTLVEAAGIQAASTPALFLRGRLIVGWTSREVTGKIIVSLLDDLEMTEGELAGAGCPVVLDGSAQGTPPPCADARDRALDLPFLGRVTPRDLGLPLFTVVLGLVDGFNPCAMWVLLFLLSLLVHLHSRKRMFAIAGTFVLVSGIVYFAFMAAWFTFFDVIGKARGIQIALGAFAIFVGLVHAKDFFAFHKGLSFSIPESAKPGIYAKVNRILHAENLSGALATVIVLALMVNLVELLCTAGLPAIYTNVLAQHDLPRWQYYGYIAAYQVFYMLDDMLMLVIAIVTLSRKRMQEHAGRWLKLLSGLVMVLLGLALIFEPGWLSW